MPPEPTQGSYTCMPSLRLKDAHHQTNNVSGYIKFSALFAGRISKLANKILVGSANEIRKFKISITEAIFIEMVDQVAEFRSGIFVFPAFLLKSIFPSTPSRLPGLSPEAFLGADPLQANPLYEDYFSLYLIFVFVTILFV